MLPNGNSTRRGHVVRRINGTVQAMTVGSSRTATGSGQPAQRWSSEVTADHRRILYATFGGWTFDGYETYALVVAIVPALMQFGVAADGIAFHAGLAIGLTLLGWGIGGLVGGVLADYVGRKRIMLYSILGYAVFSGLTALSTSFEMLVALRFLTGIAMGSEWATGATLIQETWPERARTKGAGFMQAGFGVGTLLASLVWLFVGSHGPGAWRIMFVIGILPAFIILYIRNRINESERWQQAVAERRWSATGEAASSSGVVQTDRRPFTVSELMREPEARRRVLLTLLLSLGMIVGWYAISTFLPQYAGPLAARSGETDPKHWATLASIFYNVGAVVGYLISGFVADAVGRRKFIGIIFVGSLVMTPVTYYWAGGIRSFMLVAAVNGLFTLGGFAWFAIYVPELFATTVRSTATSLIFNFTRLIAWVGPIITGSLIATFSGVSRAALIMGCVYFLGLAVLALPETKGRPLPA